ncbi:adhesion G protein-coupled receptor L3-like, partial [Pomacea canaliculata]|uniref:adhesion G protein-coupled receptor L3-like n=1 Tax=Pomacea canaliculata TaxID=400727 RepID=UPI000D72AC16
LEENEVLNVCIETLEALKHVPKIRSSPLWQHLLSWIAIPMSILCVFLTFAVYALLPALRTQPGLNVMGTCAALFVAQVALMLASNLQTSGVWCQALGILVHEAWLSVFCWMVVCSMHMFQVFSAKTRHESRSLIWETTQNIAVSILLPAVVVALVVAVSYVQSKGESIGYSSESCFLSSQLLVGTAMVLPLSVIVVLNLVLFLLTLRRIHEVTKLKPHSDSRQETYQHVWVCARLSMLTGVMWTLSLLSEGLDLDWLRGLSILANGGQGVLLLISYVTTRRVRMLLYTRVGYRDDVTSNTRSTTDKLSSTIVDAVSTIHSLEQKS